LGTGVNARETYCLSRFIFPEKCLTSHWSEITNLVPAVFLINIQRYRNRDSAVGIANGYGLDHRGFGVRVPVRARVFSSPHPSDVFWGPHSFLSNRYRSYFHGGKRPGRKAEHSHTVPRSRKRRSIHPLPHTPS
jgi:hypothetical protein